MEVEEEKKEGVNTLLQRRLSGRLRLLTDCEPLWY